MGLLSSKMMRFSARGALRAFSTASTRAMRRMSPAVRGQPHVISSHRLGSRLPFRRVFSSSLPPHTVHGLPALSPTMEAGNLTEWLINEGDTFGPGDVIARIETDKATVDLEAQDDGILAKILVPAGSNDLAVGSPIFLTVEDEDAVGAFSSYVASQGEPEDAPTTPAVEPSAPAVAAASSFPAHRLEGLPALSPTMETGNLTEWLVKEGEFFAPGDVLARIETDKATVDLEAQDEGVVAKILVPAGTDGVAVGSTIMVICEDEADIAAFATYSESGTSVAASAPQPAPAAAQAAPSAPAGAPRIAGARVIASPFARKTAAEKGIDLSTLTGSGPGGRIVVKDVLAAPTTSTQAAVPAPAAPAATPTQSAPVAASLPAAPAPGIMYTDVPNTQMRKVIAKRLCESKQTIPHYYLSLECEMDALMRLRQTMKSEHDVKVSVNDFVIKASSCALKKVPEVNAQWSETAIRYLHNVDICVAVATEGGLVTPIVTDVPSRGLSDISSTVKDLATRARDGKLAPAEMIGGSFTVSNLGMFGISHFTSIINPPQVAILAVGGSTQKVVPDGVTEDGTPQFRVANVMTVTLSCDHRVVDGAVGAQWLQSFKGYIEDPIKMIL